VSEVLRRNLAALSGSDPALAERLRRFRAAQTDAVLDSPDPAA